MDKAGMLEFTYYELSELFWRVKEIKIDSVNLSSSNLWSYNSDPTDNLPLASSETQLVCGPSIKYAYNNYYIYNEDSNGGVFIGTIFPFGYTNNGNFNFEYAYIKDVYFDKINNLYYVVPYLKAVMDNDRGRYYDFKTPEGPGNMESFTGSSGYPPDPEAPENPFYPGHKESCLLATANAFCSPYSDITKWSVSSYCYAAFFCYPDDNDHSIIGDSDGGDCYAIGQITQYNSTYTNTGSWTLFNRTEPLGPYTKPLAWNAGVALGSVGTYSYTTLSGTTKTCDIYGLATCGFNSPYSPSQYPYYTINVPSVSCDVSVTAITKWDYNP